MEIFLSRSKEYPHDKLERLFYPRASYIASIFNYYLSDQLEGYQEYDELILVLAMQIPGYLGYESVKHMGRGVFISYWRDMDAVQV